jgi:hypothetical protein
LVFIGSIAIDKIVPPQGLLREVYLQDKITSAVFALRVLTEEKGLEKRINRIIASTRIFFIISTSFY